LTTTETAASRDRIEQNHRAFAAAVARARDCFETRRLLEAAVHAGVASNLATWMHPGLFASGDLERVRLGQERTPPAARLRDARLPDHVTRGGLSGRRRRE